MLRSLVGSEMCIRDRIDGDARGGAAISIREVTGIPIKFLGTGEGLDAICLLYTSDAADDLLCVDLGGRRIIKKKKQPTTHRRYKRTTYVIHKAQSNKDCTDSY